MSNNQSTNSATLRKCFQATARLPGRVGHAWEPAGEMMVTKQANVKEAEVSPHALALLIADRVGNPVAF